MAASNASTNLAVMIGLNIREARDASGMTQHALAVALGTGDAMTISRWERGAHRPSDQSLVALAELLKRPVSWFYTEPADREAA